jgi:acyl-[acyl-carrier-protein]-phospholipid O-acyltransferase/long-chain-fatty-acid--[acyl-carrier-protein] ligase
MSGVTSNPSESSQTVSPATELESPADPHAGLPRLYHDRSFWGMTATQFLGAFNDNLFKQLMLLLAIPIGAEAATKADEQGLATMVFALPFILFSGLAGYLSDRYSKRTVILLAKVAEIGIMALGMLAFLEYGMFGYRGLLVVLFLMGTHSAFFGPGKYGILPELFRQTDLPRANGVILMTTFLAIIFGTASAGVLGTLVGDAGGERDPQRLWVGSAVCM